MYLKKHKYYANLTKLTSLKEIKFTFENSTFLKKIVNEINKSKEKKFINKSTKTKINTKYREKIIS